jgi:hypothetical protein
MVTISDDIMASLLEKVETVHLIAAADGYKLDNSDAMNALNNYGHAMLAIASAEPKTVEGLSYDTGAKNVVQKLTELQTNVKAIGYESPSEMLMLGGTDHVASAHLDL